MRASPRIALRSCMLRRRRLMRRGRLLRRSAGRVIAVVRGRPRHLGVARRRRSCRALWTAVHRRAVVRAICIASRKTIVARRRPRHIVRRRVRRSIAPGNLIIGGSASRRRTRYVVRGISLIRACRCTGSVRDVAIALRRSSTVPSRRRGLISVEVGRRSRVGHDAAVGRRGGRNTVSQRRASAKHGLSGRSHIGRADKLSLAEC